MVSGAPGVAKQFQVSLQDDGRADSFKVKGTGGTPGVSAPAFPNPVQVSTTYSFQYDPTKPVISSASPRVDHGMGNTATWIRLLTGGFPADGEVTVVCWDPGGLSDTYLLQFH